MTTPTIDELRERLDASFPPYHQANNISVALTLAYIKALCAEAYPQATKVRCDVTDQGGDTLVFIGLEDANGDDIDEADEDDTFRDRIEDALMNVTDADVTNAGSRRRPIPTIDLTMDFPIPPKPPVLYRKCAECHLFVVQDEHIGSPGQESDWDHLHRDDEADLAIAESHSAQPSDMLATLATWKAFGPPEMRVRFTDGPQRFAAFVLEGDTVGGFPLPDDQNTDGIERYVLDHLDVTVLHDPEPHNAQEG